MNSGPFREPPQERVEYLVVFSNDNGKALSRELTRHAANGFRVVPGGSATGGYDSGLYVIMQRTTTE